MNRHWGFEGTTGGGEIMSTPVVGLRGRRKEKERRERKEREREGVG